MIRNEFNSTGFVRTLFIKLAKRLQQFISRFVTNYSSVESLNFDNVQHCYDYWHQQQPIGDKREKYIFERDSRWRTRMRLCVSDPNDIVTMKLL